MNSAALLVLGALLFAAPPHEPWPRGEIGFLEDERMRQFYDDVANADFSVTIVNKNGKDEIDIGIEQQSFTMGELQRFFKRQRHKDFIVVGYSKNTPNGNLEDSLTRIKSYFQDAGYKRILLTHGAATSIIIHEDFRPQSDKKTD